MVLIAGAGLYGWRQARGQTPLSITGPNILQNTDFGLPGCADPNYQPPPQLPDGWSPGASGVQLSCYGFEPGGGSVQILGIGNFLRSPLVSVRPGDEYRAAFRALADKQPTEARILFHWQNAEGINIKTDIGEWQAVPLQQWSIVRAAATAPAGATHLAISIHPRSDDAIYVTDVSAGQLGVRVEPWPGGKRAALAFSFDYETAMGGLIHGKSVADDPNAAADPLARAGRMRSGAEQALKLFALHNIRATFYTNGYNFLNGNPDCQQYMENPIYAWANKANGWQSDRWQREPWFDPDPCSTEAEHPGWYFGSQIPMLQAAQQDIQSHTFAHFAGTYVGPDDWRKDIAAWNEVAGSQNVAPATSLAFPWSSSYGMTAANWDVLARSGIRSVTRTVWSEGQRRSRIADRENWTLRQHPAQPDITIVPDIADNLKPQTRDQVLQQMRDALANRGVIDVWAHTEEVTSPDQIATWQSVINVAVRDFWIAPVPEIVQYAQDVRQIEIEVQTEQPNYTFTIRNTGKRDLKGVTVTLPFEPQTITIDNTAASVDGTQLLLDLPREGEKTVTLTGLPGEAA